mgnify:CR=1 FL=1
MGFVDTKGKKVDLICTKDVAASITNTIGRIRNGEYHVKEKNLKTIEPVILETCDDELEAKLGYEYWLDYYEALGYNVRWGNKRVKSRHHLEVRIEHIMGGYRPIVRLYNARGNMSYTLGIFDSINEANEFVYTINTQSEPIGEEGKRVRRIRLLYASNSRTSDYYQKLHRKKVKTILRV